ncbi:MAG: hypothetical protein OEL58_02440 [Desulfobacteraceae bacterium]|nr:hypothetical protein [Desulfobacteraceae bacterium]
MNLKSRKTRILVIDVGRFYAMASVFYVHFIERIRDLGTGTWGRGLGDVGKKVTF